MLKINEVITNESNKMKNFDKRIDKFGFGTPGEDTLLNGDAKIFFVREIHNITASSCFHCDKCDHKYLT